MFVSSFVYSLLNHPTCALILIFHFKIMDILGMNWVNTVLIVDVYYSVAHFFGKRFGGFS